MVAKRRGSGMRLAQTGQTSFPRIPFLPQYGSRMQVSEYFTLIISQFRRRRNKKLHIIMQTVANPQTSTTAVIQYCWATVSGKGY